MTHPTDRPTPRHTTTRRHHRATLARGHPPCGICGHPIDYTLPHLDPGEYVVDHITPLALGGTDLLPNKQPAHRKCNAEKGARLTHVLRSGSLNR